MGRIAFVTDSIAALPADQVKKYNITVVPLQVIFGTEVFRDGLDLTEDQFFERLKVAKKLPTTSQPTTGEFEETYKKLLDDPEVDSIISVHLSSKLSGTVDAAAAAAERVKGDSPKEVTVIDSFSGYMGEGLMAIGGARTAEQGKSHSEVVQFIKSMVPKMQVLLLVDTLEYLQRGGRIGGAQAFIGGLLNIKPLLYLRDGRLEPLEKVRVRRKGMERLVEIGAEGAHGRPCQVAVGHAQVPEDAKMLSQIVHEKMNVAEEFNSPLGPVISTHTGPGVLGFVYYPLDDSEKNLILP